MFDRIEDLIWGIKDFKREHKAKKELKEAEKKYPNFWDEFHKEKFFYRMKYFNLNGPQAIEIMRFLIREYKDGYEKETKEKRTIACGPNLFFYLNYKPKTNDLSVSIEIKDGWYVNHKAIQKVTGNVFNFKTGEVYYNFSSENFWKKYYNERKQELANRISNGLQYSSKEVENFEHICGKDFCDKAPYSLVGEGFPYLLDGINHEDIRMNIDAEYYNPYLNKVEKMSFRNVWPCCKCNEYSINRNGYDYHYYSSFDEIKNLYGEKIPFWKILDKDFDYLSFKMNQEAIRIKINTK